MRTPRMSVTDAALCLALVVAAGFLAVTGDVGRAALAAALAVAWGWAATARAGTRRRVPVRLRSSHRRA